MGGPEYLRPRRRAPRVAIPRGGPVSIVGGELVNVSPYGMCIRSRLAMEAEAVHRFRLLIEDEKADVQARVAVCHSAGPHRYEIGLEFVEAPEVRARLTSVLAGLRSDA
jgi:hypothetical protein